MIKFGEIEKEKKRSLEDETDYTPRHYETENYKLGLIFKTLDKSWGTNTSKKVREKLGDAKRWDLPFELLKNVTCQFFTQLNEKDKLEYMLKITFSFVESIATKEDEQKAINKYKGWPDQISKFVASDAKAACDTQFSQTKADLSVSLSDVTKKFTGLDIFVDKQFSNLTAPAMSSVSSFGIPNPSLCKNIYTLTKVYKVTVK